MKFHLHIGLEKTGTTSLQNTLSENSDSVLKQGFAYYRSPYPVAKGHYPNAAELLPYALVASKGNQLKSSYVGKSNEYLKEFRSNFKKSVLEFSDIHAHRDVIFSLEHLSRSLKLDEEWDRLKKLIEETGRKTWIHVYLRRQDDFCLSFYPVELIYGRKTPFEFPAVTGINSFLNYRNFLEQLVRVFGQNDLLVHSYDLDIEAFGGTLEHFSHQIGLDCSNMDQSDDTNARMGIKEAEFLRQFNAHVEKSGAARIPSHILRRALQCNSVIEDIYEPGYSKQVEFLRQFYSSNDFVNQNFFSDRPALPVDESGISKTTESKVNLDVGDCMQIFYNLLSERTDV